ncbi:hypothetical protein [Mycoplasmopsis felis]|uniref:hypothetical protein n=1 Tax=Mycoplasmopsis felis TaxID=33923 RepID=UPI003A4D7D38
MYGIAIYKYNDSYKNSILDDLAISLSQPEEIFLNVKNKDDFDLFYKNILLTKKYDYNDEELEKFKDFINYLIDNNDTLENFLINSNLFIHLTNKNYTKNSKVMLYIKKDDNNTNIRKIDFYSIFGHFEHPMIRDNKDETDLPLILIYIYPKNMELNINEDEFKQESKSEINRHIDYAIN